MQNKKDNLEKRIERAKRNIASAYSSIIIFTLKIISTVILLLTSFISHLRKIKCDVKRAQHQNTMKQMNES